MKGDFTRFSHDPDKHYTSVLKQQGRVSLDSDWNEYVAIRDHLERTEATDVIGCCGVPEEGGGFKIVPAVTASDGELDATVEDEWGDSLAVSPGRIYADGLLCENSPVDREGLDEAARLLTEQENHPGFELPGAGEEGFYLVYLDVWQRHVTALEDESIREVALGGPNTTTRIQTVWQVQMEFYEGTEEFEETEGIQCPPCDWDARTDEPRLKAWADPAEQDEQLCEIPQAGGYRGIENRLYRVEVHDGGPEGTATFKWSRDNGAVVYPIASVDARADNTWVTLGKRPRDQTLALHPQEWVEITWRARELQEEPGLMRQVLAPEDPPEGGGANETRVRLSQPSGGETVPSTADVTNLKIRRWDHASGDGGVRPLKEGTALELEEGVFIEFKENRTYETGDYWTVPARAVIEGVLWPNESGGETGGDRSTALFQPREGVFHHTCPLAIVEVRSVDEGGEFRRERDCRRTFPSLTEVETTCCRTVRPGGDLRQAIDEVIDAGGGCVSLCRGVYEVEAPLEIRDAQDLTVHGVGDATIVHLVNEETEDDPPLPSGVVLRGCRNVSLEKMLVVGEDVQSVVATGSHPEGDSNRTLTLDETTVVHRDLFSLTGEASEQAVSASALRLADASEVQVWNSRLLAPTGVLSRFGHELPMPTPVPDRPAIGDEQHEITFESITPSDRDAFETDTSFQSGDANIQVSKTTVGDGSDGQAQVATKRGTLRGLECFGVRLDINFLQDYDGSASDLAVRVINQPGDKFELQVNGETQTAENTITNFDGTTIGGVDVDVETDPDVDGGEVLGFDGNVRRLGIGGGDLFVHDIKFRIRPLREVPSVESIAYGDGVHDLRIDDSEIHFSRYGVFSCRSEQWVIEDSTLKQLDTQVLAGLEDLPSHFSSVRAATLLRQNIDAIRGATPDELERRAAAVKSFLWRDSRIATSDLTSARSVDIWWQIRGAIAENSLSSSHRGLHAFWLHDASWRENRLAASEGTACSFWGSSQSRIDGNRIESRIGLVNAFVSDELFDLGRWLREVGTIYSTGSSSQELARALWLLLEESVRLMKLDSLVRWVKQQAVSLYQDFGLVDGPGGIHERIVFQPPLYVVATLILDRLDGANLDRFNRRMSPVLSLSVTSNRMETSRDTIHLEEILTLGGIEVAENTLYAGTSGQFGQPVRLDAAGVAANIHLVAVFWKAIVDRAVSEGALSELLEGGSFQRQYANDYLIRENTLHGLNTAIESNLFDLDIIGNHITLESRPYTREEFSRVVEMLSGHEKLQILAPSLQDGAVGELRDARSKFETQLDQPSSESVFAASRDRLSSSAALDTRIKQALNAYSEADEQGNRQRAARRLIEIVTDLEHVANTHGIWMKGSGFRIARNHVLVPPEVEDVRAPRGGVRMEGKSKANIMTVAFAYLANQDPLLGVTETVITNNEIIGGLAYGVDVHEQLSRKGASENGEVSASDGETSGFSAPGVPGISDLKIRENEVQGMGSGGIVIRPTAYAVDVHVSENSIIDCANEDIEGAGVLSPRRSTSLGYSYSYKEELRGGIVLVNTGLCRVNDNEVRNSAHQEGAFGIAADTIVQLAVEDNAVTGCGPTPQEPAEAGGGVFVSRIAGQVSVRRNELIENEPLSLYIDNSSLSDALVSRVRNRVEVSAQASLDTAGGAQVQVADNRIRAALESFDSQELFVPRLLMIRNVEQLLFSENTIQGSVPPSKERYDVLGQIVVGNAATVSNNLFEVVDAAGHGLYLEDIPPLGSSSDSNQQKVIVFGNMGADGARILVSEAAVGRIQDGFNQPSVRPV